jgi:urocanate hydratase
MAIPWDVMGGVARRAWARNENSISTSAEYNEIYNEGNHITLPFITDDELIEKLVNKEF